jgi:hypothetical protein
MIALLSVLFTASLVLAAVSPTDIARIKAKVEAGEMLSQADIRLAEEINATTDSRIDINEALATAKARAAGVTAPRRPRNTLDDYIWNPATYDWVDISGTGTNTGLAGDDQNVGAFNLGFSFPFYGGTYSSVRVCSNGWLSFTEATSTTYSNTALPNTAAPNNVVYGFWDDLTASGGTVLYYADAANNRFIVSYHVARLADTGTLFDFQIILYANGDIKYQYQTIPVDPNSCTVGIENADASMALQAGFDGSGFVPAAETALVINQPDGVPNPVTNLASNVNSTTVTLTWVDPNHDTNGNVMTPDSIQIFLGNPDLGNMIGHVFHGVQTFVHNNAPTGTITYYVRAKGPLYVGASVTTTVLVGNASYNEDFEASDGQWTCGDGGWTWGAPSNAGAPAPHSGTNMWGVGMAANYASSQCSNLDLNLGLNVTSPTASIEFWMWFSCENYFDGVNFQVSVDDGVTWTVVEPEVPYNEDAIYTGNACIPGMRGWSGTLANSWIHYVVPLGEFDGMTPIMRLSFGSDSSVPGIGVFIDDMTIWGLGVPVTHPVSGTVTLDGGLGDITQVLVRSNGVGNPSTHPAANGTYSLANVQAGNRIFTTTLAGYVTGTLPVTVNGPVTNANITLRREAPPAPVLVSVEVNSSTGLATLVWTNSDPSVDLYKIYRKDRDVQDWTLAQTVNGVNTLTATDQLPAGGIWQYVVTATDVDLVPPPIESLYSNMIQVIYGALPPIAPSADGRFDDRIRVSWRLPGTSPETEVFYDNGTNSPNVDGIGFWGSQPAFGWLVAHYQSSSGAVTITRLKDYLTSFATMDDPTQVGIFEDDGTGRPVMEPIGVLDATVSVNDAWQEFELDPPVTVTSGSFFVGIRQMTTNAICLGGDEETPFLNNTFFYNYAGTAWASYEPGLLAIPMQRAIVIGDFGVVAELSPTPVNMPAMQKTHSIASKTQWASSITKVVKGKTSTAKEVAPTLAASARPMNSERNIFNTERRLQATGPVMAHAQASTSYSDRGRNTLDEVVYYKVYRGTTPGALSDIAHVNGQNTLSYDDMVAEGITYYYAVSAYYDNNQESTQTTPPVSAMAHMAPGLPTNVTATSVGVTQKRFNWTDPTVNADGTPCVDLANIRIYRDGTLIATVAPGVGMYLDTPPQNDALYTYGIAGIDEVPNEGAPYVLVTGVIPPWEPVTPYEWIDISGTGTPGPSGDDANMGPIDLGFTFQNDYFPAGYSSVYICTNGWASFTSTSAVYFNTEIPAAAEPNATLYAFWDDFVPTAGQILYYSDVANGRFIISYLGVNHIGTTTPETFQIVIDAGGSIMFNYQEINLNTGNTVGVENADGTDAFQLYYNGVGNFAPVSESSVAFWRGAPIFAPVSGTVTLDGGAGTMTAVTVTASGMNNPFAHPAAGGAYTIPLVQIGNRRITGTLAGYHTVVLPITIPEAGYTGANMTLRRLNPVAPTNFAGTVNSSNGHCDMTWTISPDLLVDGYKLYRRLQGETTWNLIQTINGRSTVTYTDILTVAGIYQYVLTAFDSGVVPPAVESDYSNQIQVLYGALPPVMLTANGNFDNKIHLGWLAPGTPPEVEVFYDNGENSPDIDGIGFWGSQPAFGWLVTHYQGNGPITITRLKNYFTSFATTGDPTQVGVFEDDGTGMPALEPVAVLDATVDVNDAWQEFTLDPAVTVTSGSFFVGLRQMTSNSICIGGDDVTPFMNNTFYYNYAGASWVTYEPGLMAIPLQRAFCIGDIGNDLVAELMPSPVTGAISKHNFPVSAPKGLAMTKGTSAKVSKSATDSKTSQMMAEHARLTGGRGSNHDTAMNEARLASAVGPHAPYTLASERSSGRGRMTLDEVVSYRVMSPDVNTILATVPATQTFYDHTPLVENIPHNYWVRAVYDNGQVSLPSQNDAVVARCNSAPSAPTNLTCTSNGSSTLTLTWTNPATNMDGSACVDLVECIVYRDGEIAATVPSPGASYVDTPPVPNQFYTYTVKAADEVPNEGPLSDPTTCAVVSPWEVTDYEWVDITGDGTPLPGADDANYGPFDLGFTFEFYGNVFTSVNICTNGWASFSSTSTAYFNACIPDPSEFNPNDVVYPFWDDMNSSSGGTIYYYADAANQRFIISWEGVFKYGTSDPYTFQIILGADNSVKFNYSDVLDPSSCTVGVENGDGTDAIQLLCNGGDVMYTPENGTSVQFWGGPAGQINGQVRSFGTNPQPIANAAVYAIQGTDSISGITDAQGNFALRVEPATYAVYMIHNNYCDTLYTNVVVEDGGTTTRNGTLKQPGFENDHTSLSIQAHQNEPVAVSFRLTNPATAQCPMDFRITHTGLPWLTIAPSSGTIVPGANVEVWATATPNVVPGDYNTNIVTTFNGAGSPNTMRIDVNVLDAPQPGLDIPTVFALRQNYPNPFNPTTVLPFEIPQQSHVEIMIYNVMGQEVLHPVSGDYVAGRYKVTIDAGNLPSGMYLVKMHAGDFSSMNKMMLLK